MRADYSGLFSEGHRVIEEGDERHDERQRVSGFLETWGWEYNLDMVAENDRISWNDILLNWNVIEFLNRLQYLKDKGKFLIALNGSK